MADRTLSSELKHAGVRLLAVTDALDMQAQGAMWVYSPLLEDWRYYLVTSLVDTIGRRKTYRLLLDAFERVELPKEMTIEDVHLGSPNDPLFQLISEVVRKEGPGIAEFHNCKFNDVTFDGVLYRSTKAMPTEAQARQIEKQFQKRVRELVAHGHE